jgi:hypothetical protein
MSGGEPLRTSNAAILFQFDEKSQIDTRNRSARAWFGSGAAAN